MKAGPRFAEDRAFWQAELDGLELSDAVQNPQQRADRSAWRRVFHLPADFSARGEIIRRVRAVCSRTCSSRPLSPSPLRCAPTRATR